MIILSRERWDMVRAHGDARYPARLVRSHCRHHVGLARVLPGLLELWHRPFHVSRVDEVVGAIIVNLIILDICYCIATIRIVFKMITT